jgi:hypothetical protein
VAPGWSKSKRPFDPARHSSRCRSDKKARGGRQIIDGIYSSRDAPNRWPRVQGSLPAVQGAARRGSAAGATSAAPDRGPRPPVETALPGGHLARPAPRRPAALAGRGGGAVQGHPPAGVALGEVPTRLAPGNILLRIGNQLLPAMARAISSACCSGDSLATASSSSPWSREVPASASISEIFLARVASRLTAPVLRPVAADTT